jgi:cytochrome oxidase Cu insertion factor (SCO1/SenC/PrrC family)
VGRRLGRIVTGCSGAFLLGMAVLQAWPGRGFWQGGTAANPGSLAAMADQMSATPQPHVLSSAVSSFASFDSGHGWGVNLFAVVALAGIGLALLSGRRRAMFPALVALIVLGLADWVFIEDFGFLGGVGTDPNSMVPLLLLVTGGYLALVHAPETVDVPTPESDAEGAPTGGSWWSRVDSGYAGRLALAAAAVFVVMVGSIPMASASSRRQADAVVTESVDGLPAVISGRAPDFNLVDQNGRPVTLASLRGFTVALTFLDPVCTTDCPLIAQEFRQADQRLGSAATKVKFVAIAANPVYHSVAVIDAFDRQEGLDEVPNWLFLTGSTARLRSVLNAYAVADDVLPAGGMVAHADSAFVIDADGTSRVALDDDPGPQTVDVSSFSNLLASEVSAVMRS